LPYATLALIWQAPAPCASPWWWRSSGAGACGHSTVSWS